MISNDKHGKFEKNILDLFILLTGVLWTGGLK